MYKLMRTEDGLCRTYYRRRAAIYCIQNEGGYGRQRLEFYRCSSNGEPSYPIDMPGINEFDNYIEP